jgi:N-dimethylarginine dimethylaminohydrolase
MTGSVSITRCDEHSALSRVAVVSPRSAFSGGRIERQWRDLRFTSPPDQARAVDEHAAFCELLAAAGACVEEITIAPEDDEMTLDAIYARDASVVSPRGMILCRMGKPARRGEPAAQRRWFESRGIPIRGAIEAPGCLEGGDVVWFDDRTVAVGQGYRTNASGIAQFQALLGPGIEVSVVALPHHRGPADVFHLMSIVSPVDEDLAVVFSPLMPVPFRQWLIARGIELVEVPTEEFEAMGANVLAVAPRRCVMLEGLPLTRARLEAAGAEVMTYTGQEISMKGGGGPTCLTRPLVRAAAAGRHSAAPSSASNRGA